jgi:hypothetical protein
MSEYGFFRQFEGKTLAPGQQFAFIFGTFTAPANQPLGSSGLMGGLDFSIWLTDSILESAVVPVVNFTLGENSSSSTMSFFDSVPIKVPDAGQVPDGGQTSVLLGIATLGLLRLRAKLR